MSFSASWADDLNLPNINEDSKQLSQNPKIVQFLETQNSHLSSDFPNRINLFTDGKLDKNAAGLRISETKNQLPDTNQGLLFFYELVTNAMRVPHWHANAMEIGTVLEGKMRVTIWEGSGKTKVFTVEKNGTWIIPKAVLHSLENVGPDKMKFLVAYDSPIAADRDFVTAWAALPDEILAKAVGLTPKDIEQIKKTTVNRLSSFDPSAGPEQVDVKSPLSNSFNEVKPLYQSALGSLTRIDSSKNPNLGNMAFQKSILKPNVLRIPHWYTSGDVLFFVEKGHAFFTMMNDDGKVYNVKARPGDLISIPVGNFHGFLNIGNEDLVVYEVFNQAHDIREITLKNGVQNFNTGAMSGTTGLNQTLIKKIANDKSDDFMVNF
jgi:oxalate decarboxylase/phosphoglucose isomerase-like protein (cupin superfamily)